MSVSNRDKIRAVTDGEFRPASEIAERIKAKFPEAPVTSQGLAMPLSILKMEGVLEDDNVSWPTPKKWRKKKLSLLDEAVQAHIELGLGKNAEEVLRYLASKQVEEHADQYNAISKNAAQLRAARAEAKKKAEAV